MLKNKLGEHDFEMTLTKFESELTGFEYEDVSDENEEDKEIPFDAEKIRIEQRMLSLKYIKELLDSKELELSPGFQRNRVWKEPKRKSLLIESLMLRIPIPAFYFYEDENSKYYVIDGLQRLSTIEDYLNDKFKLSNLQYLQSGSGNKRFSELEQKYKNRIYHTQLAVNIIDARTPSQVKFDLFRRINTGGIALNAQEIRNSIAKTKVRKLLKEMAHHPSFLRVAGNINDDRMAAQELVLRFIAFYEAFDVEKCYVNYEKGDLELFLDHAFEVLNNSSDIELMEYKRMFITAMENSYALFGRYAFRKCTYDDFKNKKMLLNKSLFVTWSVLLAHVKLSFGELALKKEKACSVLSTRLEFDELYKQSLSIGTNAKRRVKFNFETACEILKEVLKND
ncbi:DUF262 domain-containing protein [Bacillus fungorum]|uniref:DUF262 domain-containing protein n=1 Tax=Bacillus fungorum TaxID=2039284 RepID=UPI0033909EE2